MRRVGLCLDPFGSGLVRAAGASADRSRGGRSVRLGGEHPGGFSEGSVYVFGRSDTSWSPVEHLSLEDGEPAERFGTAVAIRDGTVVVTAPNTDFPSGVESGSVYVFEPAPEVIFSDGFESGIISAWSNVVP